MELILITVIVPCRNEERHITETIQNIIKQNGIDEKFTFELFVIDGMSNDRTVELVKKEIENNNRIKIFFKLKKITPAAFNIGINNAKGEYICILGAHAKISKEYLINCLNTISKVNADNVGGPWKAEGYGYVGKAIALAFQSLFSAGGAKSHNLNYEGYVDTVWGGFYKREVFERIGLFDEELIRNQDDELNYRLIKNGGKIWQAPDIKYSYICRSSVKSLFRQYIQYGYWKVRVIQKHKIPASIRHLIPGMFVFMILLSAILSIFLEIFFNIFKGSIIIYIGLDMLISLCICIRLINIKYFLILPIIFAIFHFGYGFGFLKGVLDFVILRRYKKKKIKDASLTR